MSDRDALLAAAAHQLERPFRDPDLPHAVVNPAGTQPSADRRCNR